MKYKLCLFDFDYTLVDTSKPIVESFKYTFETLNLDGFDEEVAKKTIGMTLRDGFSLMGNINDEDLINKCLEISRSKSEEITAPNTVLFDDTINTLSELKKKNIKIGIVSTRNGKRIISILEYLDCLKYIDFVVGAEDVSIHKPSPEGLLKAMEYFNCNKDEVLYVGDSYIDAKAAENANLDFVGVTTGTTSQIDFEEYNSIRIVDKLSNILDLV